MKILIISDSHIPTRGNIDYASFFENNNFEYIFHCGDYDTIDFYKYLSNSFGKKFVGVYGNMDGIEIRNQCKEIVVKELNGVSIGMIHSNQIKPRGDINKLLDILINNNFDILLYGHTHIKSIISYSNGILNKESKFNGIKDGIKYIINPGSLLNEDYLIIDI